MDWHTWVQKVLEDIVLWGAGVTALGYGIRRLYKFAKNIDTLLELARENAAERQRVHDVLEKRDRFLDDQMAIMANDIKNIKKELQPNGGSSLRDAVNGIATRLAVVEERERLILNRSERP